MIAYHEVKSSWVEGFGFDSSTSTLYVATDSGKCYKIPGVSAVDMDELLKREADGDSLGNFVSTTLFKNYAPMQVTMAVVLAQTGATGATSASQAQQAKGKRKGPFRFADLLLPAARTGLFSFQ